MSVDAHRMRLVAHMLCPQRALEGLAQPDAELYPALLETCRQNKVPLLALDRNAPLLAAFYASPIFQNAHAEEQARYADLRQEYMPVHGAFLGAGIQDVLLKTVGLAPALPYSSDNLDVLVAAQDGRRASEILHALGYVELKNVQEPAKFLFRKLHRGHTVSIVHLHASVGWGTGFMDDAHVLANARPAPDAPLLYIPAPEDALLITLAHAFYEDKAVKLGDLWKAMYLLRQGLLDWDAIDRQATQRGWREGLDTCVWLWGALERALYGEHSFPAEIMRRAQQRAPSFSRRYLEARLGEGAPAFPFRISFSFSKRHYYRKVQRDQALPMGQKLVDALRHSLAGIRRRLPFTSQRPMLISLSGIDGSGKSTYAEALHAAFGECGIRVRTAWSRGASSAFTDRIIALAKPLLARGDAGGDLRADTRPAKVARKRAWLRQPILRWGWTWLVVLDLLLGYGRKVSWPLWRGGVVICDRYLYDALVELAVLAERPEVARSMAAKVLGWLCPRPHLAYLLTVPPDLALARKPEETLEFLAGQDQLFRQLAPAWEMRLFSATGDQAANTDALVHKVLEEYYRHWRTLINGLFLANPIAER